MGGGGQQFQQPKRIDWGTRNFTGPTTDDNRGDGYMSFHQDNSSMSSPAYDPYAWAYGYGYGGYPGYGGYYGGYDPYGYGMYDNATSAYYGGAAQLEEKWGEVDQTSLSDLEEAGAIQEYGEGSILVIANGPEDMRQLDHNAEADMIANSLGGDRNAIVLWNPSAEALQAMLSAGKFQDVVLSGHGDQGTVYMTGADGEAVAVDAKTFTGYFEDSGVQNVFLNMCHGAGGQDSVAASLAEAGMNVLGWQTSVKDSTAQDAAGTLATLFADGTEVTDLQQAAATNENLTFMAGQPQPQSEAAPAAPAATPAVTTPAPVVDPVVEEPLLDPYNDVMMGRYNAKMLQFEMF